MLRPEVVLSRKAGSNHIFGELFRISLCGFVPRMAQDGDPSFFILRADLSCRWCSQAGDFRPHADKSRPLLGPSS